MATQTNSTADNSDPADPLRPRPTQDTRGYFMLPQSPMESGYYTYGLLYDKPDKGAYQYAHPIMMTAILRVGLEWQAIDRRRFGVGNISLPDARKIKDHRSHVDGLQVDVRALRKDVRRQCAGSTRNTIWRQQSS
jgi:penicillin-insensitive murein endopeptidase